MGSRRVDPFSAVLKQHDRMAKATQADKPAPTPSGPLWKVRRWKPGEDGINELIPIDQRAATKAELVAEAVRLWGFYGWTMVHQKQPAWSVEPALEHLGPCNTNPSGIGACGDKPIALIKVHLSSTVRRLPPRPIEELL